MFDLVNPEKSLSKLYQMTKDAQTQQKPNGFDTLLSVIPKMNLRSQVRDSLIKALKGLLLDVSVSEAAKVRVRETMRILLAQDPHQPPKSRMQVNNEENSTIIGKRTVREEVKDVEMRDETPQNNNEKRLKVIEDSPLKAVFD